MGCGISSPKVAELPQEDDSGGAVAAPAPATAPSGPQVRSVRKSGWRKGDLIGTGASGRVYLGLEEDSGAIIAVKEIVFGKNHDREELKQMQEEIELLRTLHHNNIVAYLGTDVDDQTLYIFTEWVPGGSIMALVNKFGRLPEAIVRKYVAQLLVGLQYLHEQQVIHRDIKAANVLVDDRGVIKLADFGSSKRMDSMGTVGSGNLSLRGTPYFMAPEVITQTGHGRKADIWSVGCTILQMVTGQPPWKSLQLATPAALMFHIAHTTDPPPMPDTLSPELLSMLLLCFSRDVDKRPNADELLQHEFMVANGAAAEAIEAGQKKSDSPLSSSGLPMSPPPLLRMPSSSPSPPRVATNNEDAVRFEKAADQMIAKHHQQDQRDAFAQAKNNKVMDLNSMTTTVTATRSQRRNLRSVVPADDPPKLATTPRVIGEESDEMLITTFISKEAAAQFAGADKRFPDRPPTAKPNGAPPPRISYSGRPESANMTAWHQRQQPKGNKENYEKSPSLQPKKPTNRHSGLKPFSVSAGDGLKRFGAHVSPVLAEDASARTLTSHNPHDDRPIVTAAAKRAAAAEIRQEKIRAELHEQRVKKNEQFQQELDRFKATMNNAEPRVV